MKYIYGPIPSRRLGRSLGISPFIEKKCNLNCVYCMLGLTKNISNRFHDDVEVDLIIKELKTVLESNPEIDVISIVGEGEPTLYKSLGELIDVIRSITDLPIAVITNSTKLTDKNVVENLKKVDFVLPSLDAYDDISFKAINRPAKGLNFSDMFMGLKEFSHEYKGHLWLEIMIVDGYNASRAAIESFKTLLSEIRYDRLYINSPVRPPALKTVKPVNHQQMEIISAELGGVNLDLLANPDFFSSEDNDIEAIISIIKRHPMNQFEIDCFLESRSNPKKSEVFNILRSNKSIEVISYQGIDTFRFKVGEKYEIFR